MGDFFGVGAFADEAEADLRIHRLQLATEGVHFGRAFLHLIDERRIGAPSTSS